jgi:hypothetical protein
MTQHRKIAMALFAIALVSIGIVGPARADSPRADVVREADIQAKIDQKVGSEAADRQAIQDLLKRPDVKRIAGTAGLDVERASAAVGLLSGAELKDIAAQANEVNGITGGADHVTLAVTTIIIILLLIIILAN